MTPIFHTLAPFAALTLTLYIAVAAFGPRRVRIPLMMASASRLGSLGLFWLFYIAVVPVS